MIVAKMPKRRSGVGSFTDLQRYLETVKASDDKTGEVSHFRREDCIATWATGVTSQKTAAIEMQSVVNRAVARSTRGYEGTDPVYHLVVSWRRQDNVTVEMAKQVQDDIMRSIGAEGHQSFAALHFDEDRGYHMHLGVNRVNAATLKVMNEWQDYSKLERASEWAEREYGLVVDVHTNWRMRVGERDLSFELEVVELGQSPERLAAGQTGAPSRLAASGKTARARQHFSWAAIVRERVVPAMRKTLANRAATANDLFANLRGHGLKIERREYVHPDGRSTFGYVVSGPEKGQHIGLRDLGFSASELETRFGPMKMPTDEKTFRGRANLVRGQIVTWRAWQDVNHDLTRLGVGIGNLGGGRAQLIDLVSGQRMPLAGKSGLGISLSELESRLGPFVASQPMRAIEAGDQQRRADGLVAAAKLLCADPLTAIKPFETNQSTWTRDDVTRAIRVKLGLRHDEEEQIVGEVVDVVLGHCELIDGVYTSAMVRAEERAMFAAAAQLCESGSKRPLIRAAGPELDDQQRAAYAHLAGETGISIVTGIAGAGKSRLLRDFVTASEEAGLRVIGTAVAGKATRVLGREAEVDSRTLARLLHQLAKGKETLTSRDIIVVDEASAVGTEQARQLLQYAAASGARIRLVGDLSQHQAVGRGAVLRGLIEDCGAYDMSQTRRANHSWMREMATDLRQGQVGKAIDKLEKNGCIHAYETTTEAHAFLAREFIAARSQTITMKDGTTRPHEAMLLADSTAEMDAMNRVVQRQLLDAETLGDSRELSTAFGRETFFVNDIIMLREPRVSKNGISWVNGDTATIVGHGMDGILRLKHVDGRTDEWNTKTHGAVQLGYSMTSFRAQGDTVDTLFMVPAANLRGTYVDITRARDKVVMAYGEDRVRDLGRAMQQAQRDQGKTLVRDAERNVAQRASREAKRLAHESRRADIEEIKTRLEKMNVQPGSVEVTRARVADRTGRERSRDERQR